MFLAVVVVEIIYCSSPGFTFLVVAAKQEKIPTRLALVHALNKHTVTNTVCF